MKVTDVIPRLVTRDMGGRLWNPRTRWTTKTMVLVFVTTDDGRVGVGEAWVSDGSAQALVEVVKDDVRPRLVGEDPCFAARLWAQVSATTLQSARAGIVAAALGAVDTALFDLIGKIAGLPLHRLLGAHRERVFCYASAGLYGEGKSADDLGREMAGYIAQGFTMVKMKVGGAPFAQDLHRVAAAREAIGGARLMVDGLYNFAVPDAIRFARAIERYDVEWFEAPVSPYDVRGMAEVNAKSPIPVCGNETEPTADRFRQLIEARAVSLVQLDIAACGGITGGRKIAGLAEAFHLPVTLHAASSSVLMAASLQLAAATPNCHSLEHHMVHQWLWERAPEGTFALEDGGYLRVPELPGIGVELDPDELGAR